MLRGGKSLETCFSWGPRGQTGVQTQGLLNRGTPRINAEAGGARDSHEHGCPDRSVCLAKGIVSAPPRCSSLLPWGLLSSFLGKSSTAILPRGSAAVLSFCPTWAWECWLCRALGDKSWSSYGSSLPPTKITLISQFPGHTEAPQGFQKPLRRGVLWGSHC